MNTGAGFHVSILKSSKLGGDIGGTALSVPPATSMIFLTIAWDEFSLPLVLAFLDPPTLKSGSAEVLFWRFWLGELSSSSDEIWADAIAELKTPDSLRVWTMTYGYAKETISSQAETVVGYTRWPWLWDIEIGWLPSAHICVSRCPSLGASESTVYRSTRHVHCTYKNEDIEHIKTRNKIRMYQKTVIVGLYVILHKHRKEKKKDICY